MKGNITAFSGFKSQGVYEISADGHLDKPMNGFNHHLASNKTTASNPEDLGPQRPAVMPAAEKTHDSTKLPIIVRQHDIFNLVLIFMLNVLNFYYLMGWQDGTLLKHCSVAYFLADAAFVGIYPHSVKSPGVILGHHAITLGLLAIPYLYPEPFTMRGLAYCMLVEINTWFLISKRTIPYAKALQEVMFYASWVVLRLIWYPYLCYVFTQDWLNQADKCGSLWNPVLLAPAFQVFLTGLNVQWTLALLLKKKGPRSKHL